jgi:uncharacterized membrane protein YjgN (DUF898 family)
VETETQAAAPSGQAHVHSFSFTGSASEYFRVWIVNLFLSIITLGIYSPWAKVRKKRYLYGNTWVGGANFDYHGDPIAILKGRIIAVTALVGYNLASHYLPKLGTAVVLVLLVAAPWLIVRSMQFNAVNSSYRNLRFRFSGTYREGLLAIAPLLLSPLIALILPSVDPSNPAPTGWMLATVLLPSVPFILFYPYVVGALKRFQVGNAAYGSQALSIELRIGSLYGIYILTSLIFIGLLFAIGTTMVFFFMLSPAYGWVTLTIGYVAVIAITFGYSSSRVTNLTFNSSRLGDSVRFVSKLSAIKLGYIYLMNVLAIVFSVGLAVPWAVVRVAKYRAESLRIETAGDLEQYLGAVARPVSATGDQMGEFFDVDFSL